MALLEVAGLAACVCIPPFGPASFAAFLVGGARITGATAHRSRMTGIVGLSSGAAPLTWRWRTCALDRSTRSIVGVHAQFVLVRPRAIWTVGSTCCLGKAFSAWFRIDTGNINLRPGTIWRLKAGRFIGAPPTST